MARLIIIINLMSGIDKIFYTGLIIPGCYAGIQKFKGSTCYTNIIRKYNFPTNIFTLFIFAFIMESFYQTKVQ